MVRLQFSRDPEAILISIDGVAHTTTSPETQRVCCVWRTGDALGQHKSLVEA